MIIERVIQSKIQHALSSKKVIIVYGARQVGKTTIIKEILKNNRQGVYLSCDEPDVLDVFTGKTSSEMKAFLRGATTIFLDEAQRVRNVGISLKLLHDTYPELTIVATGSSSFDLANETNEPLTGRNIPFTLYPVSFLEYQKYVGGLEAKRLLDYRIIYGMYPAVVTADDARQEVKLLTKDYLFKDVFRIETIRKPLVVEKLAQLLAYQIGQEVSYNELAQKLEISRQTVMSYVRLLEQAFIVFRVSPLGKNPRNEVTRFEKIYFYDTGIRNALIDNFDSLKNRFDKGALFENFFIAERLKVYQQKNKDVHQYFWRTKEGSEIDLIEVYRDQMEAFECKWDAEKVSTRAWNNAFPDTTVQVVNNKNITMLLV